MNERELQIMKCLFPYAVAEREKAIHEKTKLAHYASAKTALNILRKREVWLRDSRCMNDFMEVQHGLRLIFGFLNETTRRTAFVTAVNAIHAGVGEEVIAKFGDWQTRLWAGTYILSMSAHAGGDEDKYGRLSMWRAYGRAAGGVAIVMNVPMDQTNEDFNVFLSPVHYTENIDDEMSRIIGNIGAQRPLLATIPRDELLNRLFSMLAMAACCLKHPGFKEELEWRLVYLPLTWASKYVTEAYEPIDDVPQTVYKLKFEDVVRAGQVGAEPLTLIDRVIIGPTAYPGTITDQVFFALKKLGFTDPTKHISTSFIPLRM